MAEQFFNSDGAARVAAKTPKAVPVFGERVSGAEYVARPGAYVIVTDSRGLVAVVRTASGCSLPGGGIEAGETAGAALVREVREECGARVCARRTGLRCIQYVYATGEGHFAKECVYFRGQFVGGAAGAVDGMHELCWMAVADAMVALDHESHRWAVRVALSGDDRAASDCDAG